MLIVHIIHSCFITISGLYFDENNEFRPLVMSYYDAYRLIIAIKQFGKDLCHIDLLLHSFEDHDDFYECDISTIDFIISGCPKLKTLSLGSLNVPGKFPVRCFPDLHSEGHSNLLVFEEHLPWLLEICKDLEYLKITNAKIWLYTEDEVKKMFPPNFNVEIKDCEFIKPCEICGQRGGGVYHKGYQTRLHESYCICACMPISYDSEDELKYYFSDDSGDVSFDDGEQDSNSEGANDEDETNDIPDAMEEN